MIQNFAKYYKGKTTQYVIKSQNEKTNSVNKQKRQKIFKKQKLMYCRRKYRFLG